MAVDPDAKPVADAINRQLETGIVERHQTTAAIADEMVVVLAGWVRHLVAGDPVADVEPVDQLVVVQKLERAIDAGATDPTVIVLQHIFDLLRAEGTVSLREELDQPIPGRPSMVPGALQHLARMLGPSFPDLRFHCSKHNLHPGSLRLRIVLIPW